MKTIAFILLILFNAAGHAQNTYVLVHGAFADFHVWDSLRPLLEAQGNKVVSVNLPDHGAGNRDPHMLHLASYTNLIIDAVNAQHRKVILLGHSMAGMVISAVAEKIPDRIKCLVYVAAFLPQNGQSLRALSSLDTASLVGQNLEYANDYSTACMKPDQIVSIVCEDCGPAIKKGLPAHLKAEPLGPLNDSVSLSPENFGRLKKYYIFTTKDHSITYPFQQFMVRANGKMQKEFIMRTSHLPFVAKLKEFTDILLEIGKLN